MTDTLTPVLTAHWDQPDTFTIDGYRRAGGWQALPKALGMSPDDVITVVKNAGLRGRGGAGFADRREVELPAAGRRQAALPGGQRGRVRTGHLQGRPADDGQPAPAHRGRGHRRVRDRGRPRVHLRPGRGAARDPAAAQRGAGGVRGRATSARTSSAPGSTWRSSSTPGPAPTSAARRPRCWTRWRASAGCRGTSRRSRPWPACTPCPTVVNNVESIASVPSIVLNGADWFADLGTEKSKGFGIFSLSGHVSTPGTVRGSARHHAARAARAGRRDPGRAPAEVLDRRAARRRRCSPTEHLDVPLDFESVAAAGSMLGTRALQIFDDTTCVVGAVLRWTEFYQHESCGKCTPCREGTFWLVRILDRLEHGEGTEEDLEKLLDICDNIIGRAFCALGDSATSPDHLRRPVLHGTSSSSTTRRAAVRSTRRPRLSWERDSMTGGDRRRTR